MEPGVKQSLSQAERRSRRLVLAYPKSWRERYGDEFVGTTGS